MIATETEQSILAIHATRLIVYTDGAGKVLRVLRREDATDDPPAERLDLLTAAAATLGSAGQLGELRSCVLMFSGSMVLGGSLGDRVVYFICDSDVRQLGLLLRHQRILVSEAMELPSTNAGEVG